MELIEYNWDEITGLATFVYEDQKGHITVKAHEAPLQVETPSKEHYWAELLHYINTQGEP
jgi:hypothetical protein